VNRYVIYARISSAGQRNNASLDQQVDMCRRFGQERGWELVETIREQGRGTTLDRSGVQHALRLIDGSIADVIVSYRVDRIARDAYVFHEFLARIFSTGGKVAIVDDDFVLNDMEEFHSNLSIRQKGTFGQMEVDSLHSRISDGMSRAARLGGFLTSPMYGYALRRVQVGEMKIKVPVIVEAEAVTVRRVFQEVLDGRTLREVAGALNAENVTAPRVENYWTYTQVRRVIQKYGARYAGQPFIHTRKVKGEVLSVEYRYPPIISPDSVRLAQAILKSRGSQYKPRPSYQVPLKKRTRCSACGRVGTIFSGTAGASKATHYAIFCASYHTAQAYGRAGYSSGSCCAHSVSLKAVLNEINRYITNQVTVEVLAKKVEQAISVLSTSEAEVGKMLSIDSKFRGLQREREIGLVQPGNDLSDQPRVFKEDELPRVPTGAF
jgi:DNA invertase Pin-like site-specific DNA recombinase